MPAQQHADRPLRELQAFQHDGIRGCLDGVVPSRALRLELAYGTLYLTKADRGPDTRLRVVLAGTGGGFVREDYATRNQLAWQLEALDVDASTKGTFGPPDEIVPSRFRAGGA